MKIRPNRRALLASLLAASGLLGPAGCASTREQGLTRPAARAAPGPMPKKEYAWKDMSAGKSFNRPIGDAPD